MPPIAVKKNYSPQKRTEIVTAYKNKVSVQVLAQQEGVSRSAIYGIISRYATQQGGEDLPRSGRPLALTDRQKKKRHIVRLFDQDPFISNGQLIKNADLFCSVRTLTRQPSISISMHGGHRREPHAVGAGDQIKKREPRQHMRPRSSNKLKPLGQSKQPPSTTILDSISRSRVGFSTARTK